MTRLGSGAGHGSGGTRRGPGHGDPEGAIVTESGIALVHEGELIFPAPDSRAEVAYAQADARMTVTINLPVIVQVAGGNDTAETDRIVSETLRRLRYAVEAQTETV